MNVQYFIGSRQIDEWLRAGPKAGWRRYIAAWLLNRFRSNSTRFYTVQGSDDPLRLMSSGKPWPTAPERAALGEGIYAWQRRVDAEVYLSRIVERAPDVRIMTFRVNNKQLSSFRHLNVDALPEPEAWMSRYSKLWSGTPAHSYQYIQRGTAIGIEHFFDKSVFRHLKFR
jgi:hypothetical protein